MSFAIVRFINITDECLRFQQICRAHMSFDIHGPVSVEARQYHQLVVLGRFHTDMGMEAAGYNGRYRRHVRLVEIPTLQVYFIY